MARYPRETLRHSPVPHTTHKISNGLNVQDEPRGLFFKLCSLELILGNLVPISPQAAVTEGSEAILCRKNTVNSERIASDVAG